MVVRRSHHAESVGRINGANRRGNLCSHRPALPVYEQPICPGPGYLWTPGYWAWSDDNGYYWVPGTWVVAPVGLLWTPGYWGWNAGFYGWHAGYWGPHIGFYGGINYGFGYGGVGFVGGEWRGGAFFYNSAVMHVNTVNVTNVYVNKTVIVNNTTVNHTSFNGGTGGVVAQPTPAEQAAANEQHTAPVAAQTQHEQAAGRDPQMLASNNHGSPAVAATAKPGEFSGHNVVAAKSAGAPYHAPAMTPQQARGPSTPVANNAHTTAPAANEAHPATSTPNNNGFHSFTPPNKNNSSPASTNNSNASKSFTPPANSRPANTTNTEQHQSPPNNASHPQNQSHPAAKQPPKKQSPPPKEKER